MFTKFAFILFLTCCLFAEWPQFKQTPNHVGCGLSETVTLPATLTAWVDFGSPIQASPAVVNGRAYCISSKGILAKIDLATNTVDWHTKLGGVNNQSTPAVGSGKVYVGSTDGKVYTVSDADGTILNEYQTGGPVFADILMLSSGFYVGSFDKKFYAFDLDGNLKWSYTAVLDIVHGAAASGDTIVFSSGDNYLYALKDAGTSYTEIYKVQDFWDPRGKTMSGFVNAPTIWNGSIYAGKTQAEMVPGEHRLMRFSLATGVFAENLGDNTTVRIAISVDTASGWLYIGSAYSGMKALPPSGSSWSTVSYWAAYPDGIFGVNSSPAVISNAVIFGSEEGNVYFYQKTAKTELWAYGVATGQSISSSPAVSNGTVVIGGMDGMLYALGAGTEVTTPAVIDTLTTISRKPEYGAGKWTLNVFPNPSTSQYVRFTAQGFEPGAILSVYDIKGALVQRLKADHDMIWNTGTISAGNYIAMLQDRSGKSLKSFNIRILK
jgi:outer membrane protein assembly factor BamB